MDHGTYVAIVDSYAGTTQYSQEQLTEALNRYVNDHAGFIRSMSNPPSFVQTVCGMIDDGAVLTHENVQVLQKYVTSFRDQAAVLEESAQALKKVLPTTNPGFMLIVNCPGIQDFIKRVRLFPEGSTFKTEDLYAARTGNMYLTTLYRILNLYIKTNCVVGRLRGNGKADMRFFKPTPEIQALLLLETTDGWCKMTEVLRGRLTLPHTRVVADPKELNQDISILDRALKTEVIES